MGMCLQFSVCYTHTMPLLFSDLHILFSQLSQLVPELIPLTLQALIFPQ